MALGKRRRVAIEKNEEERHFKKTKKVDKRVETKKDTDWKNEEAYEEKKEDE